MNIVKQKPMSLKVKFRSKLQKKGSTSYIYCRIRYNGQDATDFSTFIPCTPNWDKINQIFIGRDQQSILANDTLSEIKTDIEILLKELRRKSEPNVHDLRNQYVKRKEKRSLLDQYKIHENYVKTHLGQPGYSKGTKKAHASLDRIIKRFLIHQGRKDIQLVDIRQSFGKDFVKYLKTVKKYKQNYVVRNLSHLQRLLQYAVKDEYLEKNPLGNLHEKIAPPGDPKFLTENEVALIKENNLLNNHLTRVADAFLFQCFTGLAYCDLKRFSAKLHITKLHGRDIIQYSRQKGAVLFTIPVLSYTRHLLDKYNGVIPVISNQKMNEFLKTVAKTVGIEKNLTTHVGRKTAGTYLLNNDVPLEVVSRILGHKSIRTTEKIYAFMLQETVLRHTVHLT